jgi:hypothetical protein
LLTGQFFSKYYAICASVATTVVVMILLNVSIQLENAFSVVSFPRQEIEDGENDWTLREFPPGEVSEILTDHGITRLRYENNATECRRAAYFDSLQNHFHPPDIKSVGYLSNGSVLNATLWLSNIYEKPASNASAWLVSNVRDSPWYRSGYLLSVNVHGAYDVRGADYAVRYDWDAINNTWTKRIEEIAPSGENRYLVTEVNYDIFKNNGNNSKNYIDMSLEMSRLNYPQQYSIVFSVYDHFVHNGRVCTLSDIIPRVHIPPPTFNLSTSPSSVELRAGDEKNIILQLRSNSNVPAKVHFILDNESFGDRIRADLSADKISVPPYGLVTSNIKIRPLEDTAVDSYTLPIHASLDIATVATTRRSVEAITNLQNQSLNKSSYFTITVLPSLTFEQKLDNFVKQWVLPLTGIWTFLAGVGAVMVPLIIRIYRKSKNRDTSRREDFK